jgi:hypothetical protein
MTINKILQRSFILTPTDEKRKRICYDLTNGENYESIDYQTALD